VLATSPLSLGQPQATERKSISLPGAVLASASACCAWGRVARTGNKVLEIPMDVAGIRSQDTTFSLPSNKSASGHKRLSNPIRNQHFRSML